MRGKYIAFEGVMGTGKTTLAKFAAEHLQSQSMYEIVDDNPFLDKFYSDPDHWAFQTEAFFLCNRYMQLKLVRERLDKESAIVSDYHIMKNLIFAELTLTGEELDKYRELYNIMIDGFPSPDIIVYSEASLAEVLRRINLRGRKMEKDIDPIYIGNLIEAYIEKMKLDNLDKYYPGTQLIEIDADKVDFFKSPDKLKELYELIDNAIEFPCIKYQKLN